MRILVTGAGGFVGRGLMERLLGGALGFDVDEVIAVDQQLDPSVSWHADPRVTAKTIDFASAELLQVLAARPCDLVFHLASVPGSLAEREPTLGKRVNLEASLTLFHHLAAHRRAAPLRVVFASTVAVYGTVTSHAHGRMDEDHPTSPELSYGAHKLMTEVLLGDLSRRGELDAVSLRLPGIVARPLSSGGHGSAFMSDIFHKVAAAQAYTCPVGAGATCWWMSLGTCVENLIHAALIPSARLPASRVVQLPVLTAQVGQVIDAVAGLVGQAAQVTHAPDDRIERLFGRCPPLHTPRARALGFSSDATLETLARRCLPGLAG
ncbi:NAD-dependent epimerase/dehydratase family protein [Roseateles koreensis]|uniref:NAD-dependent epimerase/dehydratase family protein n=1 Tax=Roseateles koreensis TaxID=2987526 RepID=A0ABT5KP17_9BURK|nr:NAD-dependent epimerase/dehydratase family protein [Roseateles koreensis]MDC8784664.1 NAD-dependent epimerase/dehydratase family protein [Roseateles koreensis]